MSPNSTTDYVAVLFERAPGRCGRKQVYLGTRLERHFIRRVRERFGVWETLASYPQLTEAMIRAA